MIYIERFAAAGTQESIHAVRLVPERCYFNYLRLIEFRISP